MFKNVKIDSHWTKKSIYTYTVQRFGGQDSKLTGWFQPVTPVIIRSISLSFAGFKSKISCIMLIKFFYLRDFEWLCIRRIYSCQHWLLTPYFVFKHTESKNKNKNKFLKNCISLEQVFFIGTGNSKK